MKRVLLIMAMLVIIGCGKVERIKIVNTIDSTTTVLDSTK